MRLTDLDIQTFNKDGGTWRIVLRQGLLSYSESSRELRGVERLLEVPPNYHERMTRLHPPNSRLRDLDIQTFNKDGGTWRIVLRQGLLSYSESSRELRGVERLLEVPPNYHERMTRLHPPNSRLRGCQRIACLVLRNLGKRTSVSHARSCSFRLHVRLSSLLSPNSLERIVCTCSPIDTVAGAAVFYGK